MTIAVNTKAGHGCRRGRPNKGGKKVEQLHRTRMRAVVESLVDRIKADVAGPLARLNDVELTLARQLLDDDIDEDRLDDVDDARSALYGLIMCEECARGLPGRFHFEFDDDDALLN